MLPSIAHPHFTVTLPSNNAKLKIRPMVMAEEKILLIAKQTKELTTIYDTVCQIVNRCIVEGNFDAYYAPLFDIEWVFIQLRKVSVGAMIKQVYNDTGDKKEYSFDINLDNIEVVRPPQIDNPIKVDDTTAIMMQYPVGSVYKTMKPDQIDSDVEKMKLINRCVKAIIKEGKTFPTDITSEKELEAFVDQLPIPVFEKMQQFVANMPSLSYVIEYTNSLGTKRKIVLSSLDDFFTFV